MTKAYSIKDFAGACSGHLIQDECKDDITTLLTDSRKLTFARGTAFFAFQSPRNDGHRFIDSLYASGVRVFVVGKKPSAALPGASVIKVKNVLEAFQKIAGAHRNSYNLPVFAITGSNGKTMVKEWLFQLLHEEFHIVRSPKSYNSQIGVPLSLWNIQEGHDLALIEAGISRKGEMNRLREMIRPEYGLITNIGEAHSEGFDTIEQKLKEKLLLFRECKRIYYSSDDSLIEQAVGELPEGIERCSWSQNKEADLQVMNVRTKDQRSVIEVEFKKNSFSFTIPFTDEAAIENALHCLLVALTFDIDPEELKERFKHLHAVDIRLNMSRGIQGSTLINDYYNSDPESLRIAISHLTNQVCRGKRIAVLSSFEQLKFDRHRYMEVIRLVRSKNIDLLVTIGNEWKEFVKNDKAIWWFPSTSDFIRKLGDLPVRESMILLKGARSFTFERISDQLKERLHTTFLQVDLNALIHNFNYFKSLVPENVKTMAMVKAFSYGSGSVEIANVLQYNHVDYLGVAYVEEGVELRKAGITVPIMVMNPDENVLNKLIRYRLEPEIYSLDLLNAFVEVAMERNEPEFPIHVKVESGMNRLGLTRSDVNLLALMLHRERRIVVKSVFSHLASSESEKHDAFTKTQIKRFTAVADELRKNLGYPIDRHLLNTSGISRFPGYAFEMVRLGIGLYGVDPSGRHQEQLETVTELITHISQVRLVRKGESVGYGRSFVADSEMEIAILPVGYADGYFRSLSKGKGSVWYKGRLCPIVGNVCMDMCMIDVTGMDARKGDDVEIFGKNLTVSQLAEYAETIPYEILSHVSARVPRMYSNAQ